MIRLTFERLPALRLATSPAWELLSLATIVRRGHHSPMPRERIDDWRHAVEDVSLDSLWSVVDDGEYVPDFLVPPPVQPFGDPSDDLARIASAPPDVVERQLGVLFERRSRHDGRRSGSRNAAGGSADLPSPARELRDRVVAEMREFWRLVAEPGWPLYRAVLEREILTRGRQLALHGAGTVLRELHDDVEWRPHRLAVSCEAIDLDLSCGDELLLVPSAFVWPKVFVGAPDADGRATLYYPADGSATLFAPDPGTPDDDRLASLLGGTRAELLRCLRNATTTTELAGRLSRSPSGISQHLRLLRAGGLLTRTRVGREVYYELSATGDRLVNLLDDRR